MILEITPEIQIDESELKLDFIHASGPGGQNVNKVASAVQLRFDTASPSLPDDVKARLIGIAGKRVSSSGILMLESSRFRSQSGNRQAVIAKLKTRDPLVLIREPDNQYDPNAIKVVTSQGKQIGYLNKWMAERFAELFDLYGEPVPGRVWQIIGGFRPGVFLGVEAYFEGPVLEPEGEKTA